MGKEEGTGGGNSGQLIEKKERVSTVAVPKTLSLHWAPSYIDWNVVANGVSLSHKSWHLSFLSAQQDFSFQQFSLTYVRISETPQGGFYLFTHKCTNYQRPSTDTSLNTADQNMDVKMVQSEGVRN